MIVGAVAQVGKNVLGLGERLNPHPGHAFAAHLREGHGFFGANPHRHVMTADARQRLTAVGYAGRGVVRTAGTEIRHPSDFLARTGQGRLLVLDEFQPRLDNGAGVELGDAARDDTGNHRRREFTGGGQQPFAAVNIPLAVLVILADDAGPHVALPVVQLLLHLVLDQLALFLHHQNLIQAFGKVPHAVGLQRPWHGHFVKPEADFGRVLFVYAQVFERLQHIQIGLAGSDDAQLGPRAVDGDAVQLVRPRVSQRRINLVVLQPQFLLQRIVRPADADTAFRQAEILRQDNRRVIDVDGDGSR